jgi:hypothetical protein
MSIVIPASEVSNYVMPVAFSLLGCYLFIIFLSKERIRSLGILISGICVAISIGARFTYLATVVPFIVACLFYPASINWEKRFIKVLLPFLGGLLVGLAPMAYYALSDFRSFAFNNYGYHALNTQWREMTGFTRAMSFPSKVRFGRELLFRPYNLMLLAGVLFFLSFYKDRFQGIAQYVKQAPVGMLLALLLFVISILTALTPTPSFPQYYMMPISYLFLILIYALALRSDGAGVTAQKLLLVILVLSLLYSGAAVLRPLDRLARKSSWSGIHVHAIALDIRAALEESGVHRDHKIATLSPIYVVEAGFPIYPELATAPFLYRVGDLLTPEDRDRYVGTSPNSIDSMLSQDPPAAILVGFEGELDSTFVAYAERNNYSRMDGYWGKGGELFVRQ